MNPDVQVALIMAGLPLAGGAVGWLVKHLVGVRRDVRGQGTLLETVREQVQNSHGTNLRDDVDRVLGGIDRLAEQLGTVQLDVSWLRREQLDQAKRLGLLEGAPDGV